MGKDTLQKERMTYTMIRKIIQIDEEKCSGCGLCASACHEGAIGMVNGKAKLLRDDYCDGLGDCLPACPENAISFVEREAAAYDAEAVKKNMEAKKSAASGHASFAQSASDASAETDCTSRLGQWPVQIKLAPLAAPYFAGASLLIAADCTAYAYARFHEDFIRGKITLVGCPKLDAVDYSEKLAEIIRQNDIRDITTVRMEVPCCGGLEYAVGKAIRESGKSIFHQVVTISIKGEILNQA